MGSNWHILPKQPDVQTAATGEVTEIKQTKKRQREEVEKKKPELEKEPTDGE